MKTKPQHNNVYVSVATQTVQQPVQRTGHFRHPLRGKDQVHAECLQGSKTVEFLCRLRPLVFFLASLIYVVGMLVYSGSVSVMMMQTSAPPGSVYRSNEVFMRLLPEIQNDKSSAIKFGKLWTTRRKVKHAMICTDKGINQSGRAAPSGYIMIDANGGLNQQRSSICNAVALAGLLNAVLVIPTFTLHNIWMDTSQFEDIYDGDHFISTLEGHVTVVKELPDTVKERFEYNISSIPTLKVQAWASDSYYLDTVLPLIQEHGVVRISPFANRLAVNVPPEIQRLRCLANYKALKFSTPIATLSKTLVERMVQKSSSNGGKYVAVHLRFEEDMVAFSCCVYGGGKAEKIEMDIARQKGWNKFKHQGYCLRPDLTRMQGKCPLTPLEVGLMLRGMGFRNNTPVYLASGKIYKSETSLEPLTRLFPLLQTKESLATPEELAPFQQYSSRLAALDYTVCLNSEVFITTQGGNFPHFIMGHRRMLYGGHAKTIKPDKIKLALLLHNTSITWSTFKTHMQGMLRESNRKGQMLRKRNESVYIYPFPDCSCQQELAVTSNTRLDS